jgi:hypothetical protein
MPKDGRARWKSRNPGGRPPIHAEVQALIQRMSVENVLWGGPRIQGELLKLGFAVAQSTVAKYMAQKRGPSGQSWGTFLRNHVAAHRRDGSVRGSDYQLHPALRTGDCPLDSARACLDQRDKAPDGRMDRTANH